MICAPKSRGIEHERCVRGIRSLRWAWNCNLWDLVLYFAVVLFPVGYRRQSTTVRCAGFRCSCSELSFSNCLVVLPFENV